MELFAFLIASFGVVVFVVIISLYGFARLVRFAAERDFLWTIVKEGTIKAVVAVEDGGFIRLLMQFRGHHLDENGNVVKNGDDWHKSQLDYLKEQLGLTGIYFFGIPGLHSIYKYKFRWASLTTATGKESSDQILVDVKQETIDYLLVKEDVYFSLLRSAEDRNMVPLNVRILSTIAITNGYKALFAVERWLEAAENQNVTVLRRLVAVLSWKELQSALGYNFYALNMEDQLVKLAKRTSDEEHPLTDIEEQQMREVYRNICELRNQLQENYGVDIRKLQVSSIEPAGTRGEQYEQAAAKQYEANMEKSRIREVYATVEKFGETGKFIRLMESIDKLAAGPSNTILPLLIPQSWSGVASKLLSDKSTSEEEEEKK